MNAFQSRKKKRTGIVKITDEDTNKTATDSNNRARILEKYANELYQTSGMDEDMLNMHVKTVGVWKWQYRELYSNSV